MHFEELWELCENFHKETTDMSDIGNVISALLLKMNLYKSLDAQKDMLGEEMQKVKSRALGEIVLALTCLSLKDNINVYEALGTALQLRSVDYYNKKHPL